MDEKKVINGIECLLTGRKCDSINCPYENSDSCIDAVLSDARALLKEQAEKLKKQAEKLKGQKAKKEYKSCSNCSRSTFRAVRGTGCYGYRCQKHRMWGASDFHCSDWTKRGERE